MSTKSTGRRIGFIGAGRMATALAKGLIDSEFAAARDVTASDVIEAARSAFCEETGAECVSTNREAVTERDVVLLAVKPQHMAAALADIREGISAETLIVSIAAGVTIDTLQESLGSSCRVVRVMPNTPCLVGAGASAFARGGQSTDEDAETVRQMLSTVGLAIEVPEALLDAVTGLSGSGPAYAFQMIEALSDGGVRVGLPRDVATRLSAQTLLGAAKMVLETGQHPGELKDAVTSPGGTTIAGLHALELGGVRSALMNAVEAATDRSRALGRS